MDLSALLPTSLEWWQVLIAIVVIIAGWILSRFARTATLRLLKFAPSLTEAVATFVARFVGGAVVLLAVGIALAVLGVNLQPLLALAVVLVVIAVLVLRGVADNFASGVVIQATRPVEVGDEVQVEGVDGKALTGVVRELTSRTVVLETYDGRTVHVPNGRMIAEPIVNHSRRGQRRSEVQVRTARSEGALDVELTRLAESAASVPGVDADPPARAYAVAVSPDRLVARVLFWHAPADGLGVTADVVRTLATDLQGAGIPATVTSDPGVAPLVPSDEL
ncbi:mechanosensitive ion channel family protein [Microbacterium sp. P5_E9]